MKKLGVSLWYLTLSVGRRRSCSAFFFVPPIHPPCSASARMVLTRRTSCVGGSVTAVKARNKSQTLNDAASPLKRKTSPASAVVTPSPSKKKNRNANRQGATTPTTGTSTSATTIARGVLTSQAVSSINPEEPFHDLEVPPEELRPSTTLTTGQCFHWKVVADDDENNSSSADSTSAWGTCNATEWVGVLAIPGNKPAVQHAVVVIRETPTTTLYRVLHSPVSRNEIHNELRIYFQLDTKPSLSVLYKEWSEACPRLKRIAKCIPGVRVVQQDPFECLVSFLCSSNNNIPRITQMLSAIRQEYGTPLVSIASENDIESTTFYSFPSLETLRELATEDDLRQKCGMGYRAKYLIQTIDKLHDFGGESYLQSLRNVKDPLEVQDSLCQFHGVGRKVADCIALFSLAQASAIPVDVHVWNVALRDYGLQKQLKETKSLTPTVYKQVGHLFTSRFQEKAGWAHSLLFVAELPSFRPLLPLELVEEMDKFREEEKAKKEALRQAKKK